MTESFGMAKQWYVVHTYSGFEKKVEASIKERAKALGLEDQIARVLVPTEDVVELRRGKKRVSSRKFFPGYVLVELEMDDVTWHLIKETPKVTGFVGGDTAPAPLTDEEVGALLKQVETGAAAPRMKILYHRGDTVRIADGPFTNFSGVVEEVNVDQKRLKVMVSIFGRQTPVELEFLQVEKG
jgi:transcriptional antiterminator NusG